jgi:hypothetical protein
VAAAAEGRHLIGSLLGVRLADLDQASYVVGLEEKQAEHVRSNRLARPQPAGQETEGLRQPPLVFPRQTRQVAGRPQHEEVDGPEVPPLLRRQLAEQVVDAAQAQGVLVQGRLTGRVAGPADRHRPERSAAAVLPDASEEAILGGEVVMQETPQRSGVEETTDLPAEASREQACSPAKDVLPERRRVHTENAVEGQPPPETDEIGDGAREGAGMRGQMHRVHRARGDTHDDRDPQIGIAAGQAGEHSDLVGGAGAAAGQDEGGVSQHSILSPQLAPRNASRWTSSPRTVVTAQVSGKGMAAAVASDARRAERPPT